ncbi:DUF3987 domain-containing protein [Pseudomonas yangonensis]|uniref:DUF3987 domain-containing protein n=1 Tax=Pseudomonas yangonensis TaxID=2579922 RepID=UPI00137B48BE|nr:DUF3987 domain-containing protein [Pseudomonas yangonensis]
MAQHTHNPAPPYSLPPGFVGEVAQFFLDAAPRPVLEIALAGAIGLVSAIVGRAYNVSNPPTGLNQYVLLLAPTGTGKEAIASGYSALMKSIRNAVPASADFIGPGEIASHQAVIKYMAGGKTSFVSLVGEFGIYLQQMVGLKAPPHLIGLRRFLLDAYGKSGEHGEIQPSIYSDKDKNTAAIQSPALSIVGESTPEKFYEGLNEGLVSEGLLPRFLVIEYHGDRPELNDYACAVPSPELVAKLAELCSHCLMLNQRGQPVEVQLTDEARLMFDEFNTYADEQIRGKNEVARQLWNRAHLKALKLAALVAVGWNPYMPTITPEFALWAIQLEKANVRNLLARFEAGEVGEQAASESAQQKRLRAVIKDWFSKPWAELQRYKIGTADMRAKGVIPYSYISKRLTSDAAFKSAKLGATKAIKNTIKELFDCGELQRISPKDAQEIFNTTSECYAPTNFEEFIGERKHEAMSFF